ncbi:hypothetical protein OsI_21429 [Oryza sativa Indica Group]|uniref:Uncharacterized protein n=1 Tax=Oryza sativa subsp. indica TaxID=39946 RepID=B8B1X1_ORYSI|nr:hypothetical protein OsI_21429 [Oryza sativa Indica Group]
MLWMPFTPCYADADARSKGRPWVPNPAATTSLLPDLVTRSGGQALAVSTPDGVPQRVVGYVELIGGDSSSSAAMGEDTQEAKALMIAIVPHLHRWYSRLRWPLLAGRLRRVGCLPVLVDKCALRRLRSTTFLHTKTFTPDFGILWFKASRLLAEWSSLVTLHLPLLYILAFSSRKELFLTSH